MVKRIKKEQAPVALGELIHAQSGFAIEAAVHEELAVALGAERYERHGERRGYRNGVMTRTLTGPTGPLALSLPRATFGLFQQRMREVNERCQASVRKSPHLSSESPPTRVLIGSQLLG